MSESERATHAILVERAARWLAGTKRCSVVATDIVTACSETPDAIGWAYGGNSHLIECKASRSDFFADRKKPHRAMPSLGVGFFRWYMTPPGLVRADELPDGWGLLEVMASGVRVVRKSDAFPARNASGEAAILVSLLRRERGEYGEAKGTRTTIHVVPADDPQTELEVLSA